MNGLKNTRPKYYLRPMAQITINAHYDGKQIQLDQPVELAVGSRLFVTILETSEDESDFQPLAQSGLSAAYGTSEPEYSENDLLP